MKWWARWKKSCICRSVNATIDDISANVLTGFSNALELHYMDANHKYGPTHGYLKGNPISP